MAIWTPLRKSMYPVTPTLSVEAVQATLMPVMEIAVAVTPAGTVGAAESIEEVCEVTEIGRDEPVDEAAAAFVMETEMPLGALDELYEMVPTTPLAIVFELMPVARQVYAEALPVQAIDLPADDKDDPAVTLKPVTVEG